MVVILILFKDFRPAAATAAALTIVRARTLAIAVAVVVGGRSKLVLNHNSLPLADARTRIAVRVFG